MSAASTPWRSARTASGSASGGDDRAIRIWDLASGSELATLVGSQDAITSLAFTPDGKQLVSGSSGREIKLWESATGKLLAGWEPAGAVAVLAVSPDGQRILAWSPAAGQPPLSQVAAYSPAGNALGTFSDRERRVSSLAISADTELAAMGAADGTVRLWNAAKYERVGGDLIAFASKPVSDLVITPDKKHLVTASEDGELKVWDLGQVLKGGEQKPLAVVKGHAGRVIAFAMSPKGDRFVSAGTDEEVKCFETATGKELRRWPIRQSVRNLAITPDGRQAATANGDGSLYLLSLP